MPILYTGNNRKAVAIMIDEEINKMFEGVEVETASPSDVTDSSADLLQAVSYGKIFRRKEETVKSFDKGYISPIIKQKYVLYNPKPHQENNNGCIVVQPIDLYRFKTA